MSKDSKSGKRLIVWLGIPFLVLLGLFVALIVLNRPPVVHVPTPKMPNPNGWDDFVKAGEMACNINPQGPYSGPRSPEQWTAAELQSYAAAEAPALGVMRVGLTKQCRMHAGSIWVRLEQYTRVRELARVLAGEALCYRMTGKPGSAADSILDGAEMGVVMQRGANLPGGFVGLAVEVITIRHFDALLPKLSPEDLARVAKRMERIRSERVSYSDILIEEGRFDAVQWAESFREGNRLANACDWEGWYMDPPRGGSTLGRVGHSVRFAFVSKAGMIAEGQAYLEALAKEQRGTYTGTSRIPIPSSPLFVPYGDEFVEARGCFTRNEALFAVQQAEVALLRYRAGHGHYPKTLAELAPVYMKSVPVDPFGLGKPLQYRLTNGGKTFLLYSLGPDMTDDHGKPMKDPYLAENPFLGPNPYVTSNPQGDLVAGHLSD